MSPRNQKIVDFIKANKGQYNVKQVASKFSVSEAVVYALKTRYKLADFLVPEERGGIITQASSLQEAAMVKEPTKKELKETLSHEARLRNINREKQHSERKVRVLQDTLTEKDRVIANLGELREYKAKPIIIKPRTKTRSESTAFALFSDLHIEEVVEKHKVDGLNEYTPEIGKRRAARFFELVVRMIRKERGDVDIHHLVLWLGGDFFSSNLHEELPTACAFPPMVAAKYSLDIIIGGIDYILTELPDIKLSIPTSVGNHSRMTDKVYHNSEQEHSIEWLLYNWLASHYRLDKRVTIQVAQGTNTYVDVYGYKIRFAHGHVGLKYNAGLAGIHGPLRKKIEQVWNKQVNAYITCIGHYHQYIPSSRSSRYVVNGSVIGTSPYGMQFGHEDPTQAFFLINREKGITVQIPLLLDT